MIAAVVTIYYWWQNIKGIEESTDKALSVMQVTTVMVVLLLGWGFITAFTRTRACRRCRFRRICIFPPMRLDF